VQRHDKSQALYTGGRAYVIGRSEIKMEIAYKSEKVVPGKSARLGSWLERTPVSRIFVLVLLVGATVHFGAFTLSRREYVEILGRQYESRNIAISLAKTGNFADPFSVPTGKTAHLEPIPPFLTSLIYRIWGITDRAEFVHGILCALFSTLTCGLTVLFGIEMGLSRFTSLCGGMIAALAPNGLQLRSDLTELNGALGTALFVSAVLVMLRARRYGASPLLPFVSGVLSGLTILTWNSLLAPLAALMVCAAIPVRWNPLRLPPSSVLVMILSASVVVLPWSLRNLRVFHQWVTVRSNLGLEFRLAQNDFSQGGFSTIHPAGSPETRGLMRRVGEPAAYAALGRDGLQWVRAHPVEFAKRMLKRMVAFWIPKGPSLRYAASFAVALAALCGFLLLLIQKHPAALVVGIVWLTFPAVYYLVRSHPRYQQPIAFSLYLMASVPISFVFDRYLYPDGRARNVDGTPCREW